jgi:hypothetical protein
MIDSSFHRLEWIFFNEVTFDQFVMLLFYLKSLPRLFSLNTQLVDKWTGNVGNIYRMIFSLPALKYNTLIFESDNTEEELNVSLPFATNERFSTLEYLNIGHKCATRQLFSILRHTPELRHLICKNLIESDIGNQQLVTLSHLKYLSIDCDFMKLAEFESIMKNLSSQLEVLNIEHHSDEDYFDADQWERMIKNHIPHLRQFDYGYHTFDSSEYLENVFYMKINQFISPFWTERQWFFQAEISDDVIVYSIYSHKYAKKPILLQKASLSFFRKRWFDYYELANTDRRLNQSTEHDVMSNQQSINKSSTKLTRTVQLSIHRVFSGIDQPFIDKYKTVFDAVQFTDLNIDYPRISDETLIKILQLLPNLDSLKLSSLQLAQPDCSDDNLAEMRFPTTIHNKITKVCHENTTDMGQVVFLLSLCRCMQHFQIDVSKSMDLDALLRIILIKAGTFVLQLRSLCLCIPNASEDIIHQLKNLIESERLLFNYMIKRSGNNILFKWN